MKWSNDKSKLVHDTSYLVWTGEGIDREVYGLQVYFKSDIGDTMFKGEGFYFFDNRNDIWKRSRVQPNYFLKIEKPIKQ